jgi:hypothetical protein
MSTQPEALRLADLIEAGQGDAKVVAELRRLHAANAELLEALRVFVSCSLPVSTEIDERGHRWTEAYLNQALPMARAAIAKAEGVQS